MRSDGAFKLWAQQKEKSVKGKYIQIFWLWQDTNNRKNKKNASEAWWVYGRVGRFVQVIVLPGK